MKSKQNNIPKIIHYVWLGSNEKSSLIKKCMNTWKKYCPDYKFIEWNEQNISEIDSVFLQEALKLKYWAFASDVIRLYALKTYGGIYLDTDVEITSSIDHFLNLNFFGSLEKGNTPATSFIGSQKNDPLISKLYEYYIDRHFIINSKPDLTTNPNIFRDIISIEFPDILSIKDPATKLDLGDSRILFPYYYFSRKRKHFPNYAIHHFSGSWVPRDKTFIKKIYKIGSFELWATHSQRKAEYPPKFDKSIKVLISMPFSPRRRLYLIRTIL